MAPIISLAIRRLPLTLTPSDLRDYLQGRFSAPNYHFHVWPLVNEFDGNTGIASRKCATVAVKVKVAPLQKLDKIIDTLCEDLNSIPFHYDGQQWRISADKYFHGVVPLYEHQAGASVDVFTIHGLGGHAFHTWCNEPHERPERMTYWPRDLLPPDLEDAGIAARVSSIGYNANFLRGVDPSADIKSLAEALLAELAAQKSGRPRPFFFICHSLGGLILCQALILCFYPDPSYGIEQRNYQHIFMDGNECLLKGIIFLGTPFNGSLVADNVKPFVDALKIINPYPINAGLVHALTNGNTDLADIVNKFHHIHAERNISLWIGCETQPIHGSLVTTHASATARFKRTATVAKLTNTTHTSMVRYDSPDSNYVQIARGLIQMVQKKIERGSNRITVPKVISSVGASEPSRLSHLDLQNRSHSNQQGVQQASSGRSLDHFPATNAAKTSHPLHGHSSSRGEQLIAAPASDVPDGSQLATLEQYDTVFVIDDTNSMILPANRPESEASISMGYGYTDRWSVLEVCLKNVVNTVVKQDRDGIDIRFLKCGKDYFKDGEKFDADHLNDGQAVLDRLVAIRDLLGTPKCEGGTAFFDILYPLLSERADKWKNWRKLREATMPASLPKFLNVIVVTDGAANDRTNVEWTISEIAQDLDACRAPLRCIGVQFLQIGDDAEAGEWLRQLDDDLGRQGVRFRDMIDTKPWNPQKVEQMLLGAIVDKIDREMPVT